MYNASALRAISMKTVTINALRYDTIAMRLDFYSVSTVKNKACCLMDFYLTHHLPYKASDISIQCTYNSENNS